MVIRSSVYFSMSVMHCYISTKCEAFLSTINEDFLKWNKILGNKTANSRDERPLVDQVSIPLCTSCVGMVLHSGGELIKVPCNVCPYKDNILFQKSFICEWIPLSITFLGNQMKLFNLLFANLMRPHASYIQSMNHFTSTSWMRLFHKGYFTSDQHFFSICRSIY